MNAKKNIIIDCDPGIDDTLALMLALKSPELHILGITIVCGNVPVSIGAKNVLLLLERMNRMDIPVYCGADVPLQKNYISAQDTHGMDGLGESNYIYTGTAAPFSDAVSFLCNTLMTVKNVSVLALGPLTNIALAIRQKKEAFLQINEFISMGGSFKSHGNCSPVAEYNYWCDPHAAKEVFAFFSEQAQNNTNFPLLAMVGLDVTRKIVLTPNLLKYMEYLNKNIGEFIRTITKFYFNFHWKQEHLIGCVINDPLAAAYLIRRELCEGFSAFTDVSTSGICEGQTVVDSMNFYQKQPNSYILTKVDEKAFMSFFISRLFDVDEQKVFKEISLL